MSASHYATLTDLANLGIPPAALAMISPDQKQAMLDSVSEKADGYLCKQFTLPLQAWGKDLTDAVVGMAAYQLIRNRGYQSHSGDNASFRAMYDDAERWLIGVSKGQIKPVNIVDSAPQTFGGNNTDAPRAEFPQVLQNGSAFSGPNPQDDFWGSGGACGSGGVGGPSRRGW
jgi:phage gp36-like protein